MSTGKKGDSSAWFGLGPVEQAKEWEAFQPGTFEVVFAAARLEAQENRKADARRERHERTLDYIAVFLQVFTVFCAFCAVLVFAWIAKYYADHNAPDQGAKIFGFGSGSIVAAFLGVKQFRSCVELAR